ncbi:MAG: succinate dehydrogenase iron-sulfur subunit [Planctomycetota bacterium]|jgi:succinate dehydrogenase / fumarate reductase iron-sulfur subunit
MVADTASAPRTIRVRVRRQDSPTAAPRWEEFAVPVETGANIISVLQWVNAHPVTVEGQETTPVAFEAACLEEVCGSCTMVVNGRVRQGCSCLTEECAPGTDSLVTLEPMTKFPVVRDLIVDRARMFHDLRKLKTWVPIDGTYDLGAGPPATPATQNTRYALSTCMTCGCCLEACPQFTIQPDDASWDENFVGAHAISQVRLFNEHQTGKVLQKDRLDVLMGPGGINDCGNAQNCVRVCPKEIPLTESIAAVGRAVTIHAVKKFFSGS